MSREYGRLDIEGVASWTQIRRENPMIAEHTIPQRIVMGDIFPMPQFSEKGVLLDVQLIKQEGRQNGLTEIPYEAMLQ